MKYQKIVNLSDNASNQPSKFKIKNWDEINHGSRETCNKDNQIRFKTSMLRSSLCDYSNAYIIVKGVIAIKNIAAAAVANNINKKVIFKNCVPFTNCISRINNMQVNDAHDIGAVMPMHNSIK